ncbi:helix-turn-helix domain-containing protein [Embleya sp. NPDC050154]|uniref:helix-turn-helix domain-containing protein n=1 Tax=unclassified Embleya TaxID=2699296 RepID=UPI00378D98BD
MVERDVEDDYSAREVLANQLSRLREASGKSLAQLAEDTRYDRSYLHRLETGERLSERPVMKALDDVYETRGLLVWLWKRARKEAARERYHEFMYWEAQATIMHKYMLAVPGLLQTEAYARTVLSSQPMTNKDELEAQVAERIARQDLLYRDPPPSLRVILDEAAIRRPLADSKLWQAQLARIVEAAQTPHTVIQLLPFAAGSHDLMGGSLSLLWMSDGTGVAYLEGSKSGELIEDPGEVGLHRLSYDRVRDSALSPDESVSFIKRVMEEEAS